MKRLMGEMKWEICDAALHQNRQHGQCAEDITKHKPFSFFVIVSESASASSADLRTSASQEVYLSK